MRVEVVMASRSSRRPSRFPVGTKFVIESRRGDDDKVQIFTRYLEFPDGTFLPLPQHPATEKREPKRAAKAARRRTRSRTTTH
jgi:hypothetical protein